jgi:hypothetical protein
MPAGFRTAKEAKREKDSYTEFFCMAPSSRGPGRRVLSPKTPVRLRLGLPVF